jgi:hypothetical protein
LITFHDTEFLNLRIDYDARTLSATLDLWVGDPDAPSEADRQRRRTTAVESMGEGKSRNWKYER